MTSELSILPFLSSVNFFNVEVNLIISKPKIGLNAGNRLEFILKFCEKPGMSPSSPLCHLNNKQNKFTPHLKNLLWLNLFRYVTVPNKLIIVLIIGY